MIRIKHLLACVLAVFVHVWISDLAAAAPQNRLGCIWIKTVQQLQAMRKNLAATYCLANDIDASASANFVPIGEDSGSRFTGRFYGNGYTISNLTISGAKPALGLFGSTDGAVIQDVSLINANITGKSARVGTLAGIARNSTIARIRTGGKVKCTGDSCFAGGIIGYLLDATLTGSSSTADVFTSGAGDFPLHYGGGAVGQIQGGALVRTYATGSVRCNLVCGGLVGQMSGGNIDLSFAAGPVSPVRFAHSIGGLTGATANQAGIQRSHASGPLTGGEGTRMGGLVGSAGVQTAIAHSYAVSSVSAGVSAQLGGLVGFDQGATITESYWDVETSGQMTSEGGGMGLTTAQLRAELPPGFDPSWAITKALTYPFLDVFEIEFASPLATLVHSSKVVTFLPMRQHDAWEYVTVPKNADQAALATVYTMIARAIGITNDVDKLKDVQIDRYFWDDATRTTNWTGPVKNYAKLGALTAIAGATPLDTSNVIGRMKNEKLVILRGSYKTSDGTTARHWMLGTSYTTNPDGRVSAVVAHDPRTGQQVQIDPGEKRVLWPPDFPLAMFKVNGYQPVTLLQPVP